MLYAPRDREVMAILGGAASRCTAFIPGDRV
jgi:hypothetical protein